MSLWQELMELIRQGVQLDQFSSPAVALLVAFAVGFLFGAIPTGASELLALAAGAVTPRWLVAPLLVVLTAGHVLGKLLWYWLGTFGERVTNPRMRDWIAKAHAYAAAHPTLGPSVMLTSAFASVPPFHLTTIAAGVVRMPVWLFVGSSFVGRLARFVVVAVVPGVVRWVA